MNYIEKRLPLVEQVKLLQSKEDINGTQVKCAYDFILQAILDFNDKFGIETKDTKSIIKLNNLTRTGSIVLFILYKILGLITTCIKSDGVQIESNSFVVRSTLKALFGVKIK